MGIVKGELKAIIKSKEIIDIKNGVPTFGKKIEQIEIGAWQITNAKIQLGEGDRTNVLQLDYFDPNYLIDKYIFERALLFGGIPVPETLFKSPQQEAVNATETNTATSVGGSTGAYNPKEGMKGDELAAEIVKYCYSVGVNDPAHIAAILGNITIETVMGQYTEEIGGANTRYAPFFGRGLIQITWRNNYERFGKFFGQDFVGNTNLPKLLKWAIPIAVGGTTGVNGCPLFTGVKMSDFGRSPNFDFYNSRRTVNGLDKAGLVASEAKKWLAKINAGLGKTTGGNAIATPAPAATPAAIQIPAPSTPATVAIPPSSPAAIAPNVTTVVPTPEADISESIIEIELQLGFARADAKPEGTVITPIKLAPKNFSKEIQNAPDDIITTNFYLTSRSTSSNVTGSTIGGRGIRYILNRTNRRTFQNISLRQLTKRFGDDYGIGTILPVDESVEKLVTVMSQSDETDIQFLTRIAKSQGLEVISNGKDLQLSKPKEAKRIKAQAAWGMSINTSESAESNRIIKSLPPIDALIDGEEIGEGFATTIAIANPDLEVLNLQPGSIIEIPPATILNFPDQYCRDYKLKAININYNGAFTVTLNLYIPVNVKASSAEPEAKQSSTETSVDNKSSGAGGNDAIVKAALKWVGKDFRPGQTECCMRFVRQVLADCNHPKAEFITTSPHDGQSTGRDMASSLSGADCGQKFTNKSQLPISSIVTWGGTYGGYPPSTISHVGIYIGNGEIIDRSTSSKPVNRRSIDTFPHFVVGVLLS